MNTKHPDIQPTTETMLVSGEKRIFDLRSEYANSAVKLSLIAEQHERILALSIDPELPRYFEGNPRPYRKLFSRLVKIALLAAIVDVVTVRIDNVGPDNQDNSQLKLSVTTNGPGLTPATMRDLQQPSLFRTHNKVDENRHALFLINKQIQRLGGQLRIESLHGWGTRYVIRFQLTKFTVQQLCADAS